MTARAAVHDPGATPHDAILRETAQPSTTRPRSPRKRVYRGPAPPANANRLPDAPFRVVRVGCVLRFAPRPGSKQRRATYPVAVDGPVGARGAHHGTTVPSQEKSWPVGPVSGSSASRTATAAAAAGSPPGVSGLRIEIRGPQAPSEGVDLETVVGERPARRRRSARRARSLRSGMPRPSQCRPPGSRTADLGPCSMSTIRCVWRR
jgi:hypothetical protein